MYKNIINIPQDKKRTFPWYALFVLAWMVLIFYFSAQPATASSSMSNGVIEWLKQFLPLDFLDLDTVQLLVRKSAHFLEYACLGCLSYQMFAHTSSFIHAGKWSSCFCFLYACSDEIHQFFVPGRACMWQDVLLDTTGAICGILFIISLKYIIKLHKQRS